MKAKNCPWYREPWPWLLMSGPAIVVVAGLYTAFLAVRSSDGLVADDYYKEGLAINRSLERDARAQASGIHATARFGAQGWVRISMDGAGGGTLQGLRLQLLHPTRAGMDQSMDLREVGPGLWEGRLAAVPPGAWRVQLDAPQAGWRIAGEWHPGQESIALRPVNPDHAEQAP